MEPSDLCQALLAHLAEQLPADDETLLSLRGVALFHPDEASFIVLEALAVLMRTGCGLPEHLVAAVNEHLCGSSGKDTKGSGEEPLALPG